MKEASNQSPAAGGCSRGVVDAAVTGVDGALSTGCGCGDGFGEKQRTCAGGLYSDWAAVGGMFFSVSFWRDSHCSLKRWSGLYPGAQFLSSGM